MSFDPQNILVLDFGQTGDVILSLPALRAIREKFPQAKITVFVSRASADILETIDFVDEKIVVDRVRLRRSNKFWSVWQIFKLVADVRRRKFDFVIDLHSLYETNLLGLFSGAKHRLYGNRETRSIDSLSNFRPKPPLIDRSKHYTDYYLSVLEPLGISGAKRFVEIRPRKSDLEKIENLLRGANAEEKKIAGIFPGAGNPSRRWSMDNFAETARRLSADKTLQVVVFLGPEEKALRGEVEEKFPAETVIFDGLSLLEFAAALSVVAILISNDTGAIHIGAIVGASIVVILDERAPITFLPLTEKIRAVRSGKLEEIGVEEVFQAAQKFLQAGELRGNDTGKDQQTQAE